LDFVAAVVDAALRALRVDGPAAAMFETVGPVAPPFSPTI
jgi:hypothetical protein